MALLVTDTNYLQIDKPTTPTSFFIGNVGTWQRLNIRFEFSTYIEFSQSNSLFMEEPNRFTLSDGSNWRHHGFDVGDDFSVYWEEVDIDTGATTLQSVQGVIVSIQDNVLLTNNSTLGAGAQRSNIYPTQLADAKIYNVFAVANKIPEGIAFEYGHILNSQYETAPANSLIDGTIARFIGEGLQNMNVGNFIQLTPVAPQSGMSIAAAYLSLVGIGNANPLAPAFLKRIYELDVFFMPCITFDDNSSFDPLQAPTAFSATECLADTYQISISPELNNPNIVVESKRALIAQQGNTGWFNENYNGLKDNFVIEALEYRTPNNTLTAELDYQGNTLFSATVSGVKNISGQTKCMFGFQWIPSEQTYYKNKETPFYQNTKMNTGGGIGTFSDVFNVTNLVDTAVRQGYSSDGAAMNVKNIRFRQSGVEEITFECEFEPTPAFSNFMAALDVSERNYIIWVSIGDSTLDSNETDRVSKLLDSNQMNTFVPPVGAFSGMTIDFLNHGQDQNSTPSLCGSSFKIEDGLLAKVLFSLDETLPLPTAIQYGVALQRDADGFLYELEATPIDLGVFPNVDSYNYSASRNFNLPAGNNKNFVKVDRFPSIDANNLKGVRGLYGFKIRWEDWISLGVVPVEIRNQFYDNTLNSDGLSNDWYRYLNANGWSLQFYVYLDAVVNGILSRYINLKPLVFDDYDQNPIITTQIEYKKESTGAVLSAGVDPSSGLPLGVVLENERTQVEITYTRTTGTWATLANTYSITTIELRNGAGAPDYYELSTEYAPENGNPLESSTTTLEMVLVSPTVIKTTCFINPQSLRVATDYKITGRLGCK